MCAELQQQCDVEAASVIELQAEKSRVSLIPQTDPEYARCTPLCSFVHDVPEKLTLWRHTVVGFDSSCQTDVCMMVLHLMWRRWRCLLCLLAAQTTLLYETNTQFTLQSFA